MNNLRFISLMPLNTLYDGSREALSILITLGSLLKKFAKDANLVRKSRKSEVDLYLTGVRILQLIGEVSSLLLTLQEATEYIIKRYGETPKSKNENYEKLNPEILMLP